MLFNPNPIFLPNALDIVFDVDIVQCIVKPYIHLAICNPKTIENVLKQFDANSGYANVGGVYPRSLLYSSPMLLCSLLALRSKLLIGSPMTIISTLELAHVDIGEELYWCLSKIYATLHLLIS